MTMTIDSLKVDPYRRGAALTGIKAGPHDIAHLTADSLLAWLRHKGGNNPWAENIIGALLHHEAPLAAEGPVPTLVPAELS